MDTARINWLVSEIRFLERELGVEMGYSDARKMRQGYQRWVNERMATAAGFASVKAWKHSTKEQ